jgi:ABC-type Fe3+-hydroxamate transport system substrate-binding protein
MLLSKSANSDPSVSRRSQIPHRLIFGCLCQQNLALGVQPAGFAQNVNPRIKIFDNLTEQIPYLGKWVTTKPMGLGTHNSPSLERLTQLQPDIILGADWQRE